MSDPGFYQQEDMEETVKEHKELENSIHSLTEEWEKLVENF